MGSQFTLEIPDISYANLRRGNLWGCNLVAARARKINLRQANLSQTHLNWADFSEARLTDIASRSELKIERDLNPNLCYYFSGVPRLLITGNCFNRSRSDFVS